MTRTKSTNSLPPVSVETLARRAAQSARRADDIACLLSSTHQRMARLSRQGVRLFGLLYADASPDFTRLVATRRFRDKVLVEYRPADLGTIKIQKPWDGQWLIVPCIRQEYANGLTMHMHAEIISRLRAESLRRVEIGAEGLMQAKAEMLSFIENLRQEYAAHGMAE